MAGGCRAGSLRGVDPATNNQPAGEVSDQATSSPVILPDGSVLYGARTRYNYGRGHLLRFSDMGNPLATYDFGWDITPSVFPHDGTWSVLLKDNHYAFLGSYCQGPTYCPPGPSQYDIASLSQTLAVEWRLANTSTEVCVRQPDGNVPCLPGNSVGFEWCVNQPAVDSRGTVYVSSEDGRLYAIDRSGTIQGSLFLDRALGAAYTPVAIGEDGLLYAQNNGHLFVVGNPRRDSIAPASPHRKTVSVRRPYLGSVRGHSFD